MMEWRERRAWESERSFRANSMTDRRRECGYLRAAIAPGTLDRARSSEWAHPELELVQSKFPNCWAKKNTVKTCSAVVVNDSEPTL